MKKHMKKLSLILCLVLIVLMIIEPVNVSASFIGDLDKSTRTVTSSNGTPEVKAGSVLNTLNYNVLDGKCKLQCDGTINKMNIIECADILIKGNGVINNIYCNSDTKLTTEGNVVINNITIKNEMVTLNVEKTKLKTVHILSKTATINAKGTEIGNVIVENQAVNSSIILNNSKINYMQSKTLVKLKSQGEINSEPPITGTLTPNNVIEYEGEDENNWSRPVKIDISDFTTLLSGQKIIQGTDNTDKWQIINNDGWKLEKGPGDEKNLVLVSIVPTGDGSVENPYIIYNEDDLEWLAGKVNSGLTDIHAKLTGDIDLNPNTSFDFDSETGLVKVTDGSNTAYLGTGIKGTNAFQDTPSDAGKWYDEEGKDGTYTGVLRSILPIGNNENGFNGSFDGNGHTIRGLYNNDGDADNIGLFGVLNENAQIKNLAVEAGYLFGKDCVGDICGRNAGTINSCYSYTTGCVSGQAMSVNICGSNEETGTITNSYYLAENDEGMGKTAETFASGLITRLLNGGDGETEAATGAWGQTLGTDSYPVNYTEEIKSTTEISSNPEAGVGHTGITKSNAVCKVTYTGASESSEYVNYGYDVTLDEQYYYSEEEGTPFTGKSITEDICVTTTERPKHNVSLTSRVDSVEDSTTVVLLTGGGTFYENSSVTVSAPEKEGYKFKGWYVADSYLDGYTGQAISNSLSYNFKLSEDTSLVAVYSSNANVTLTITGTDFTVNDGECQTADPYVKAYKAGTKIRLAATGENFAYWMNSSNKIVSTSAEYEFVLVGNTMYKPVYKNAEDNNAFVEFVSTYGQIVQSGVYSDTQNFELPEGPSRIGYEFTGWSMSIEDIQNAIANGGKYISVFPSYDALTAKHKVTVNYAGKGVIRNPDIYSDLAEGSTITLTAKPSTELPKFSHWALDAEGTHILGTSENYLVVVTNDLEIYVVYDNDAKVDKKPVIEVTDTYTSVTGTKNKISFCTTRDVPEGYTVQEQGILYGTDNFTDETMIIGGTNVRQYISSSPDKDKVVILNVNVGESKDTVVYARGYMIVKDDATGNMQTYYTDITSGSFNNIQ